MGERERERERESLLNGYVWLESLDWLVWMWSWNWNSVFFIFIFIFLKRWKEHEMWSNGQDLLRDCDKESVWSTLNWIEFGQLGLLGAFNVRI